MPAIPSVTTFEEAGRLAKAAQELCRKLRDEPHPHTFFEALEGGWLKTGSKTFSELSATVSPSDLKHWHTRAVKLDIALAALEALRSRTRSMFTSDVLSRTQSVLTKPAETVGWIVRHEGLLIEIFLRALQLSFNVLWQAAQAIGLEVAENVEAFVLETVWFTTGDGLEESLDEALLRFGQRMDGYDDRIKERMAKVWKDAKAAFRSIIEQLAWQAVAEVVLVVLSVDSAKKFYAPMHKRRDDAIEFVLKNMLPQDAKRFDKPTDAMLAKLSKLPAEKKEKSRLQKFLHGKMRPGELRFKRRRRSSRGHTRLVDLLGSRRAGALTKRQKQLLEMKGDAAAIAARLKKAKNIRKAVADGTAAAYHRALRKSKTLQRYERLRREAVDAGKSLKNLSANLRSAKRAEIRRLKRAAADLKLRLTGSVRRGRSTVADGLRDSN